MADTTLRLSWTTLAEVGDDLGGFMAHLSDDERARAERFRVEAARRRFVLGRTLLRREMAVETGRTPDAVVFSTGERGKPYLAKPEMTAPPHFNLSHSGELVVLAMAGTDVGVDVETLRPVANAEKLARRFFSPAERRAVSSLESDARDRAFLRIWTQKEAYLKATGLGVGMRLSDVETEPDPDAPPGLLTIGGDGEEAARWSLREVEIPGAVCTVASLGSVSGVEVVRRTPADFDRR